jgi:hypothetical protein
LTGQQQRTGNPLSYLDVRVPDRGLSPGKAGAIEVQRDLRRYFSRAGVSGRAGVPSLLQTEFVARRLGALLPAEELGRPVRLLPEGADFAERLGDTSLHELLDWSDAVLARRLGTDPEAARSVRARLLGLQLRDDAPR